VAGEFGFPFAAEIGGFRFGAVDVSLCGHLRHDFDRRGEG
jgi:hypothetical protein